MYYEIRQVSSPFSSCYANLTAYKTFNIVKYFCFLADTKQLRFFFALFSQSLVLLSQRERKMHSAKIDGCDSVSHPANTRNPVQKRIEKIKNQVSKVEKVVNAPGTKKTKKKNVLWRSGEKIYVPVRSFFRVNNEHSTIPI